MRVTAVLTHQCNLACHYCYSGRKFHRTMDEHVAWRTVALAFSDGEPASLSFFGGEPMLAFGRMVAMARAARRWARREGRAIWFAVTTNGTILGERQLRFLAEYRFQVAVSLDGAEEEHDRNRPFPSGMGSGIRVWSNLERAMSFLPGLRVLTVLAPPNVRGVPRFVGRLQALGVRRISLMPDLEADWDPGARLEVHRLYYRLARLALRHPELSLDPFDRRLYPFRRRARCCFGAGEVSVRALGDAVDLPHRLRQTRDIDLSTEAAPERMLLALNEWAATVRPPVAVLSPRAVRLRGVNVNLTLEPSDVRGFRDLYRRILERAEMVRLRRGAEELSCRVESVEDLIGTKLTRKGNQAKDLLDVDALCASLADAGRTVDPAQVRDYTADPASRDALTIYAERYPEVFS